MNRRYRNFGGPVAHGGKPNGAGMPDTMTLIRAFDSESNPTRPVRPSPLTASTIQGMPLDLLDRLRSFPLFLSAPDSFLAAIGTHLRPQVYAAHDYILTEGDDAKAMYWLVRGAVRVTSRDGESTYAELRPGAFFGEIGILMDIPRTATVVSGVRSLVVRLNKEDLVKELPAFPEVEKAIREEAKERLAILERKKKERGLGGVPRTIPGLARNGKRTRDRVDGDVEMGEEGMLRDGGVICSVSKKRKSPSPGLAEAAASSALGSVSLNVRQLLRELPLFSSLPSDILHFLGLNAQPRTYPPFTDIVQQGSTGTDVFFIIRGEVEVFTERPGPTSPAPMSPIQASPATSPDEQQQQKRPGRRPSRGDRHSPGRPQLIQHIKARLKPGQYFGEVTSLSLSPRRTATVRSIALVECLMISGDVLNDFWQRCSPDLRRQVERVARQRMEEAADSDVTMIDAGGDGTPTINELSLADVAPHRLPARKKSVPSVTFTEMGASPLQGEVRRPGTSADDRDKLSVVEPFDPDPFLNVDLDNIRSRSRRGSLAPPSPASASPAPSPGEGSPERSTNGGTNATSGREKSPSSPRSGSSRGSGSSPGPLLFSKHEATPLEQAASSFKRPKIVRHPSHLGKGALPDDVLVRVFDHLDVHELMRARAVSGHWMRLLSTSPAILQTLDLSKYNRLVTDSVLTDVICPFVGGRPRVVDISNCFHVTDEGFGALSNACAANARVWRMRSVWDVTAQAVLEMVTRAKGLEEVDLSNCRKVGDNLLARVVGWVMPELPQSVILQQQQQQQHHYHKNGRHHHHHHHNNNNHNHHNSNNNSNQSNGKHTALQQQIPPGTVLGCPRLKHLSLSYCKHITDKSMGHIAAHAAQRVESIDLTRCTTITDLGFQHWSVYPFPVLARLCLADCTYLSDNAIVYLTNAAKNLRELDLSFCCALSDTATEVLALGCPSLTHLNLAFCGSAVSDSSLRSISLHLLELRRLSVRGCVRVTGVGVEAVSDGCLRLEHFDVSQCKNLVPWLERGGVTVVNKRRERGRGRPIEFETVADGRWRAGK